MIDNANLTTNEDHTKIPKSKNYEAMWNTLKIIFSCLDIDHPNKKTQSPNSIIKIMEQLENSI